MLILQDDLTHPAVLGLLELHVRSALANSPPGRAFALDLSGLRGPAMTVWSAWEGEALMGLGALRELDPAHGEIKSMRTAREFMRRGVAGAMLGHITSVALERGHTRLSLETGGTEAFAPARAMYEAAGFVPCAPFGEYDQTDFNRCYSKVL